jgi:hypothetical protein
MECEFCKNIFSNKQNLSSHQKHAKYCLKIRGVKTYEEYKCDICQKNFTSSFNFKRHQTSCKNNIALHEYVKEIKILKDKNMILESKNELLTEQLEKYRKDFNNLSLIAIERPFFNEESYKDNDSECEIREYKLSSLDIGDGYNIEHREQDGYINVTDLCNAGGKNISDWKRLEKTITFLNALSASMGIPIDELLKYKMGSIHERATWVHPQIAINIAQWISPIFDVKVSAWVYEAMMTGKVDITSTKTYKEIQKENKALKDKYLKRRPRVEYKDKYVIYILTTRLMQKERRYIMGKATNLTNRLSTYNKSDEHRVVYYQGCGDEHTMSLVENAVFHHLHKYREQANRERFILPENEEIKLFSSCINKSIEYFKK